ncbi:VOC family protein [Nocardioides panacisoli]|uniref:VOC family protein n=1 Tax=Nocardioides panacisoli TaxID=627624 RepID=A0ABP7I3Q2_9ACTN
MTADLHALTFAAHDPTGLARFWGGLLGWEQSTDRGGSVAITPPTGAGCALRFVPSDLPKTRPNQIHLDLTSESPEAQLATVERALRLGGRPLDIGQGPEEEHVVMADPEGNELCVIEAGNRFLADCGTIGAINCDGSQAVGYFWSKALDWPLVWDQDEETAIQSPRGGSKIAWGGPPFAAKTGPARLHLDLVANGDLSVEVDRLLSLGARPAGVAPCAAEWVPLEDPDGNEFCVSPTA